MENAADVVGDGLSQQTCYWTLTGSTFLMGQAYAVGINFTLDDFTGIKLDSPLASIGLVK